MGMDLRTDEQLDDDGNVHSFGEYLDRFEQLRQRLPVSTIDSGDWLEDAAQLCRLSRYLTHAALRENVTDPALLSTTAAALTSAARSLNRYYEESEDEAVRNYRDHIGERMDIFRARFKSNSNRE